MFVPRVRIFQFCNLKVYVDLFIRGRKSGFPNGPWGLKGLYRVSQNLLDSLENSFLIKN